VPAVFRAGAGGREHAQPIETLDIEAVGQFLADRAAEFFKVRRIDLAIDDRTAAIGYEPKVAEHYESRGKLYLRNNAYPRAIADFDDAIRLEPRATYYLDRGNAYSLKGDQRRAIADFDEAIRLDRTLALAFNNRGMAWKILGDRVRALADFKAAVELQPDLEIAVLHRKEMEKTVPVPVSSAAAGAGRVVNARKP